VWSKRLLWRGIITPVLAAVNGNSYLKFDKRVRHILS